MKQKVLLMTIVLLPLFNSNCLAQLKKEKHVEDNGYVWYKTYRQLANYDLLYGVQDQYGKTIVPCDYDHVFFHHISSDPIEWGFEAEKDISKNPWKYSQAWYNMNGKCIIPVERGYTTIHKINDTYHGFGTYYDVENEKGAGICDKDGKEIIFAEGGYSTLYPHKTYYYKGTQKIEIFFFVTTDKHSNSNNTKWGIIDAEGNLIVNPIYDKPGFEPKKIGNEYWLVNAEGRKVVLCSLIKTTKNPLEGNRNEALAENPTSSPSQSSTSTSSSSSRTYYDALAFDLKGHVKSYIVENNVNDSKTSKYEFKTTGEASLITINGMRIPLSVIRRDSSKKIQGLVGFGPDEDGFEIYKYHYNSNGTLKTLEKIIPEFALLLGSGTTVDYEYNSKGILIAEKDVLRETKFNVLEVDSHNNWTKRTYKKEVYTIFGPDTATVTETRTIEYW